MAFESMRIRITGTRHLLMHDNKGVNPREPLKRQLSTVTGKRKKTEEDNDIIARLEWELALYYAPSIGPYLPAVNLLACLRDAGKRSRQGKTVTEAVWIDDDYIPLHYDGPRDLDGLYQDARFVDMRPARVQSSTVLRTRPIFPEWSATFTITWDAESIDRADLFNILRVAGQRIGLGDFRPTYGRFEVEEVS